MKTYASLAMLKRQLAVSGTAQDTDLALALVGATRYVDLAIGDLDVVADDAWTDDPLDLVVETDPPAAYVSATLALAVRFYKAPDVPFGVAGMSDQGLVAYVKQSVPEAEILIAPLRQSWGIG